MQVGIDTGGLLVAVVIGARVGATGSGLSLCGVSMVTRPVVGGSKPATTRNKLDLPTPEA